MAGETRLPVLPYGSPSLLSAISETFSFHASPESFITSRVLAFRENNPSLEESRTPIRAKILNRDVAVISSYRHVVQILQDPVVSLQISAGNAYEELMAAFFPPPNLLLSDAPDHKTMKERWQTRMEGLPSAFRSMIVDVTSNHFQVIEHGQSLDLYESMKTLSWKLLLCIFIAGVDGSKIPSAELTEIESLQEDLLRGQFSLFPVSVSTGFWKSPRAKGLAARKKLQAILASHMKGNMNGCPFAVGNPNEEADVVNHLLLFTSSLAAKALASSLTALLLNIYVFPYHRPNGDNVSLAHEIISLQDMSQRDALVRSIIAETERLSPPVVGVMRRTTEDVMLEAVQDGNLQTCVPKNWDLWLYFVGAARDPAVFSETANTFVPHRYCQSTSDSPEVCEGFAFGTGPKACLGCDTMREVALSVVNSCFGLPVRSSENSNTLWLEAKADDIPMGVQAYLGWQQDIKAAVWAKDMKQLPTQRPKRPVTVRLKRDPS